MSEALKELRSSLARMQDRCQRCGRWLPQDDAFFSIPGPCTSPRCKDDGGLLPARYGEA